MIEADLVHLASRPNRLLTVSSQILDDVEADPGLQQPDLSGSRSAGSVVKRPWLGNCPDKSDQQQDSSTTFLLEILDSYSMSLINDHIWNKYLRKLKWKEWIIFFSKMLLPVLIIHKLPWNQCDPEGELKGDSQCNAWVSQYVLVSALYSSAFCREASWQIWPAECLTAMLPHLTAHAQT